MVRAIRGLIPHRIAVNANRVATLIVKDFRGLDRGVGRVVDQVARPLDVGDFPQERGRVSQIVETRPYLGNARVVCGDSIDDSLLETGKHFTDGLINAINSGNRPRAGDDADCVCIKTRVLGLPQRVGSPPACKIAVQNGNERHGLVVLAAQDREPCDIGGNYASGLGLGVGLEQAGQSGLSVFKIIAAFKESGDIAVVGWVQAGLNTVEKIQSAIRPRPIGPGVGQVNDAACPIGVGHLGELTEVRLCRLVHGLDEFIAVCVDGLLVGTDLVNQAGSASRGVLNLMHVRVQVGQTGGHTTADLAGTDPAITANTGGVLEQLLHLRRSFGFQGCHRGSTYQNRVDGHRCRTQIHGPLSGDVTSSLRSRTNTATNSKNEVGSATDLRVGSQKQIVEVFPRVVAARVAVFHLNNQSLIRVRLCDTNDLFDLLDGSGLQTQVLEAIGAQLRDQLAGLVQFGDTCGDRHRIDGSTCAACLGNNAVDTELQVPHETIKEHRVEPRGTAGFKELLKLKTMLGEDLFGVLAATGHFRPVASICSRSNNTRPNGRGSHTRKDDGRASRQAGECR